MKSVVELIKSIYTIKTNLVLSIVLVISLSSYILLFILSSTLGNESIILSVIHSLANDAFIVFVIGIVYEKILRKETHEKIVNEMIVKIKDELPEVIINSTIYDRDFQKKLLGEEKIEEIFSWVLEHKLKNKVMAEELKNLLFDEYLSYSNTWKNLNHILSLQKANISSLGRGFLIMEDRISYKTILKKNEFNFVCTNNLDRTNELRKKYESCWTLKSAFNVNLDEPYFYIDEIKVNNLTLIQQKTTLEDGSLLFRCYNENINQYVNQEVEMIYIVRSIISRKGNFFSLYILEPTKDISIHFNVKDSGIKKVQVIPYFTTHVSPRIIRNNKESPTKIDIKIEGWVFPTSGLTFIW